MSESEYRSVFISEVKEHLVEIFDRLNMIEQKGAAGDDVLFDLFRRFHTLKGMSNTMGQTGMGEVAHLLEELLEYIRKNPGSILSFREVIMKGVNSISLEIDNYEKGLKFGSEEVISELSYISRAIKDRLNVQVTQPSPEQIDSKKLEGLYEIIFEVNKECRTPSVRAFMLLKELSSRINIIHSEPTSEMLRQGIKPSRFRVYTKEKPDYNIIDAVLKRTGDIMFVSDGPYKAEDGNKPVRTVKYIRIPFERIEELSSGLDELLLLWNKYRYSLGENNLNPHLSRLEYGFKKVLGYAERLRTVPASSIVPKLTALTESTARSLNKNVKLVVQNENIEIDKSIIDRLEEPLLHIIRNSVYHGIESSDERIMSNKPPSGIIEIIFREEEEYISITVRDDGRGIDRDKILRTAREKNLIKDENLADDEILELIFVPGFSTVSEADMTSGRGFGMDIVRNVVWQTGGDISVKSIEKEGTEIVLRIPYQFASKKVVIGEIGGFRYAFPVSQVRCILRNNDIRISDDRKSVIRGEERISLLNGGYQKAQIFIICSGQEKSIAVGMDDIVFVGETRLYKVPYVLKSSKFINSMVIVKGICPVPVISTEFLMDERNL